VVAFTAFWMTTDADPPSAFLFKEIRSSFSSSFRVLEEKNMVERFVAKARGSSRSFFLFLFLSLSARESHALR